MKKSQIRMPLWGPYSKKYMGLSRMWMIGRQKVPAMIL